MVEPLKILYLHPFSVYGGATKSLAELVSAFPAGTVEGVVLAPRGEAAKSLSSAGLRVVEIRGLSQWDNTRFGHYRGLRWLVQLRELYYWPSTFRALRYAASQGQYDVIHCNEITAILVGILAKRLIGAPLIIHVRSLQRSVDSGRITSGIANLLRRYADVVVAIDDAVRRSLPNDLPVEVVHNCMRMPYEQLDRTEVSRAMPFSVGIIGVLHRAKGLYELVEAVRLLRDRGMVIHVVVVGENVHTVDGPLGWLLCKLDFARNVRAELEALVASSGLSDCFEFTGFVSDVTAIYRRIDAVCFPSHLDAPGRPVFEAALYGLPAIVAMKNPTTDVIMHGETGLCIDSPDPEKIADAIAALAQNQSASRMMGARARALAIERFDSSNCAQRTLSIYRRIASVDHAG